MLKKISGLKKENLRLYSWHAYHIFMISSEVCLKGKSAVTVK